MNRPLTIGTIALAWTSLPALCQRASIDATLHTTDKPYVQATGEATISIKPDQAVVEIGVLSQGSTLAAATSQNAQQTEAVVSELARLLGDKKKLRTTNYSVRPNYQYPKPGAAPTITGYTATNIVEVTADDLSELSKLIDAATQSGANVVQKLQYQLRDPGAVRAQALRDAAAQARTSAEAMASGLGLKLLRVLSVEEATPEEGFGLYKKASPPPPPPGGSTPSTPLEIGMIDIAVNVVLRAEIGQ